MAIAILMFFIHIIYLMAPTCPMPYEICSSSYYIVPLILMGVFYSVLGSVIWPCYALVLDEKYLGTGFGV